MQSLRPWLDANPIALGAIGIAVFFGLLMLFIGVLMRRAGLSLRPLAFFAIFMGIVAGPQAVVERAGLAQPGPAGGGEPGERAERVMAEVESIDRGWYAGPVGWSDWSGDGEFCVALRGALLRDREAHLFAGVGVVSGSDPASELAETEIKLSALLSVIGE